MGIDAPDTTYRSVQALDAGAGVARGSLKLVPFYRIGSDSSVHFFRFRSPLSPWPAGTFLFAAFSMSGETNRVVAFLLLATLRDLAQATQTIAAETALEHRPVADGQRNLALL